MTDSDHPAGLIDDILQDLAGGWLLGLAELYAVGALGNAGEFTFDEHPDPSPPNVAPSLPSR